MICNFNNATCFLALFLSGIILGLSFAIGTTLWRLVTSK